MSYGIGLECPCCGKLVEDTGITYNYSLYFYTHIDPDNGLRWLYGQTGAAVIDRLVAARAAILDDRALEEAELTKVANGPQAGSLTGSWLPTRENAARALDTLIDWARRYPDCVFQGD